MDNTNTGTPGDSNQGGMGGGVPTPQAPVVDSGSQAPVTDQPVSEPTAQPETPVAETPGTEEQGSENPVGGAPAM